ARPDAGPVVSRQTTGPHHRPRSSIRPQADGLGVAAEARVALHVPRTGVLHAAGLREAVVLQLAVTGRVGADVLRSGGAVVVAVALTGRADAPVVAHLASGHADLTGAAVGIVTAGAGAVGHVRIAVA